MYTPEFLGVYHIFISIYLQNKARFPPFIAGTVFAGTIGAMNQPPIIVLLTDFGLSDAYVGTMKGVMLSICPAARLIDLTHAIEPQNIREAAYALLTAFRYFPAHTVFLIVIDPGVGTAREPIAIATDHGLYVAPNNGVLSYVLPHVTVQHTAVLQNPDYRLPVVSQTFHGRDIFCPASAHLATGVPISAFGPPPSELVRLPDPRLDITPTLVHGEVLHIDHFGNIITSIGCLAWTGPDTLQLQPSFGRDRDHPVPPVISARRCRVMVGTGAPLAIHRTYGDVPPGTPTALVGSSGQLEIGINQGCAAQVLAVSTGDAVTLFLDE
jgi:S-adenosylmethionine hydrolase